jgi:hypothetical protein
LETESPYKDNYDISGKRGIEIIISVLESGHSVELPATGYSMFPAIRPGDKVLVKPIEKNLLPGPGRIIVVNLNSELVMHRLIEIRNDSPGEKIFITRGDCMAEPDLPFHADQVIGLADSYIRNSRLHILICRIPSQGEYKINRMFFGLWFKLRKVRRSWII